MRASGSSLSVLYFPHETTNETKNCQGVLDDYVDHNCIGDDRIYTGTSIYLLISEYARMRGFTAWFLVILIIGALTGAFFAVRSGMDVYKKNKDIAQEIAQLQAEAERLQSENALLERKISYFRTDAFTELEAKSKLNLRRPQEKVVVVKGRATQEEDGENGLAIERVTSVSGGGEPVYKKWYTLFFAYSE